MKEFEHQFYGSTVVGKIPNTNDSEVPVSFIDKETSSAWSKVYKFDSSVGILEADHPKLLEMLEYFQRRAQKGSNFGISILNFMISIISFIEGVIKSFLGMFFGVGLMGIAIVLILLAISLMVSVYAFMIAAPLFLAITLLRWKINKKAKFEIKRLEENVMSQFFESEA